MIEQSEPQPPTLLGQIITKLQAFRPDEHSVDYNLTTWLRCFTNDNDLYQINSRFGERISRDNVIALGKDAKDDPTHVRRFALAVMIWGYGTAGYGATRTSKMLSHPQAVERLTRGAELVRAGDFVESCLYFRSSRGALSQFSWSFFTKYFYFVGAATNLNPMPLILDGSTRENGVAGGMKQLADAGNTEAARAMALWWSSADRQSAEGYALYVNLVNRWARNMGCRPDAIEMALWQGLNG